MKYLFGLLALCMSVLLPTISSATECRDSWEAWGDYIYEKDLVPHIQAVDKWKYRNDETVNSDTGDRILIYVNHDNNSFVILQENYEPGYVCKNGSGQNWRDITDESTYFELTLDLSNDSLFTKDNCIKDSGDFNDSSTTRLIQLMHGWYNLDIKHIMTISDTRHLFLTNPLGDWMLFVQKEYPDGNERYCISGIGTQWKVLAGNIPTFAYQQPLADNLARLIHPVTER